MRVQILGGAWRGRPIAVPRGATLRPTAQKVRKALFDIVSPRVPGAAVLDLFAGTGALGLEALSRGAGQVVFVDRVPACTDAIQQTLGQFGLPTAPAGQAGLPAPRGVAGPPGVTAEVLTEDAFAAIRRLGRQGRTFNLILADPPYGGFEGRKSLQAMAGSAILAPLGVVVVEDTRRHHLPALVEGRRGRLQQSRSARYGDTGLAFYQWMTPSPVLGPPLAGRSVDAASGGKTGDGVTEDPS